jgi:hypothetical protein
MIPRHRRATIIVASAVLAVLLITAYGLWSINTWSSYRTTYQNWQKELRASVDAAVTLPVTTSAERAKKMTAFKGVTDKIDTAKPSLCHIPSVIAWQRIISDLRQREDACSHVIGEADLFNKKMQATVNYLKSEQALVTIIQAALATYKEKVTEETWSSQMAVWKDASAAVAKISSTEPAFTPVKTEAVEKIRLVGAAWQDLISAHAAKDKTKYNEAQSKLVEAYAALHSVSTTSTEQLAKLATSLQLAYQQLFNAKI